MPELHDYPINVFVVDADNLPIAGAVVRALDESGVVAEATTEGVADRPVRLQLSQSYSSIKLMASVEQFEMEATVGVDVGNYTFRFVQVRQQKASGVPEVTKANGVPEATKANGVPEAKKANGVPEEKKANGAPQVGSLSPMEILNAARKAVPAVDFALGVAGVAAAGAIVVSLLGSGRGTVIILGGMLVAMVLLFAFSQLLKAQNPATTMAGIVLLWVVTLFFCTFLVFTTTAVATGWPEAWARALGLQQSQVPEAAQKLMNQIESHLRDKYYSDARREAEELVRLTPKDPHAWKLRGHVLFKNLEYANALQSFEEALKLAPGNPAILFNKGAALAALGDLEQARGIFEQLRDGDGADMASRYNLGVVYLRQSEHRKSADQLKVVYENDHSRKGKAAFGLGLGAILSKDPSRNEKLGETYLRAAVCAEPRLRGILFGAPPVDIDETFVEYAKLVKSLDEDVWFDNLKKRLNQDGQC